MNEDLIAYLEREHQPTLAYVYTPPTNQDLPIVVFCGGYRSDMGGTKASHFELFCQKRGQGYLRFDYRGHGFSDGSFDDSTIGEWAQDAIDVINHVTQGQKILLIGSSMGGWIGLLIAQRHPEILHGFIGIAAAPDFTEEIYHHQLSADQRRSLDTKGLLKVANDYSDEPYVFKKSFFEEARQNLVLDNQLKLNCPVRLFQGGQDKDVLPKTADKIKTHIDGPDTQVVLIKDGDHRLSREQDLQAIDNMIAELSR